MKIIRTIVPVSIGGFCIERFTDEQTGIGILVGKCPKPGSQRIFGSLYCLYHYRELNSKFATKWVYQNK